SGQSRRLITVGSLVRSQQAPATPYGSPPCPHVQSAVREPETAGLERRPFQTAASCSGPRKRRRATRTLSTVASLPTTRSLRRGGGLLGSPRSGAPRNRAARASTGAAARSVTRLRTVALWCDPSPARHAARRRRDRRRREEDQRAQGEAEGGLLGQREADERARA